MAESDGQVVFAVELDDTAFQEGMTRLTESLTTLGQSVAAALGAGVSQSGEAVALGGRWADGVASGVNSSRAVSNAAKRTVSAAATAASGPASSGGCGVGQNLVAGMASGALSKGSSLNAALARVVQEALTAARRAAGISSPSRLFHDEVGQYLALGVQSGFVSAMEKSVLPAIGRSVGKSAQTARGALEGTLLSLTGQANAAQLSLPDFSHVGAATLVAPALPAATMGAPAAGEGAGTVNVTQHITFESTLQAPDEVARAIRRQATYGLAGTRV